MEMRGLGVNYSLYGTLPKPCLGMIYSYLKGKSKENKNHCFPTQTWISICFKDNTKSLWLLNITRNFKCASDPNGTLTRMKDLSEHSSYLSPKCHIPSPIYSLYRDMTCGPRLWISTLSTSAASQPEQKGHMCPKHLEFKNILYFPQLLPIILLFNQKTALEYNFLFNFSFSYRSYNRLIPLLRHW